MLVGEEVYFQCERKASGTREYGVVYLGKDQNNLTNVTELSVSEGLLQVRRDGIRVPTPELERLIQLEDQAKAQGKGRYGSSTPVDRNIVWQITNAKHFVDSQAGKPVRAIIEHVRDGSTVRAFLLPGFQYITLMISGIRCPGFSLNKEGKPDPSVQVEFAEEARFFVESRLLQRDVEIVLESTNNQNLVGTILFPKGNIAEALLREGFAKCVDWSMAFMKSGKFKKFIFRILQKSSKLFFQYFFDGVNDAKLKVASKVIFSFHNDHHYFTLLTISHQSNLIATNGTFYL